MAQSNSERRIKSDAIEEEKNLMKVRPWVHKDHARLLKEIAMRMENKEIKNIALLKKFIKLEESSERSIR